MEDTAVKQHNHRSPSKIKLKSDHRVINLGVGGHTYLVGWSKITAGASTCSTGEGRHKEHTEQPRIINNVC